MNRVDPRTLDLRALIHAEPRVGRLGLPIVRSRTRAALNLFAVPLLILVAGLLWLAGVRP